MTLLCFVILLGIILGFTTSERVSVNALTDFDFVLIPAGSFPMGADMHPGHIDSGAGDQNYVKWFMIK